MFAVNKKERKKERISTKPLWGFSSSNPYHSQSRAEQLGFPFFEPSRAHLHSKFRKNVNKSEKKIFFKNSTWV